MTNPTLELMNNRVSLRVYDDRPIPQEVLDTILHAMMRAPTAGNQMLYSVIVVRDENTKKILSQTCDHQAFIATAPVILVFLADHQRWFDYYRLEGVGEYCDRKGLSFEAPQESDLLLAIEDTMIAAQNAVIAAESLGIGSCYIGDILERYEIHKELFHLPDYAVPVLMAVFGFPTEQQIERKKPARAPLSFLVHENTYRPLSEEELRASIAPNKGELSFDEWAKRFCARKYHSDFSREMSRSVQAALDHFCGRSQE